MTNEIGGVPVAGNLTADPVLREANGSRFGGFTVASTPRRYNSESRSWEDGETTFMPVNVSGQLAELTAQHLRKGTPVLVAGSLGTRSWQDRESGQKRSRIELRATHVAIIPRVDREQQGGGSAPAGDVWNAPQGGYPAGSNGANQGGGQAATDANAAWGQPGGYDDETPF